MEVKCPPPNQAGFTIIETMVAMTILLVGLVSLAMLQNTAYRANVQARNRSAATIVASQRIERLTRLGAGNFTAGTASTSVDGRTFNESWTVAATPAVNNQARTVLMTVTWSEWGITKTLNFPTVIRP